MNGTRQTSHMHKYGESKTTQIIMATLGHVTSGGGHTKFQASCIKCTRIKFLLHETTKTLNGKG